ncbi:cohesin complex subunit, partial [Linderina macrospora]
CLVPLASWCRAYPASYLDTEYLRYLGWSLNDRDPRVREVALLAIAGPLILAKPSTGNQGAVGSGVGALSGVDSVSEDSITEGIRPFIVRFLPRLVQIAVGDVDTRVQVAALKLLSLLGKHEYLDPTARIGDIRHVKRLGGSKGDGVGKSKRKNASKSTANKRSRGSYKNSLSQQMLEESSSESDASDENEGANPATDDVGEDDANLLHLQTLYSSNEDLEDNALPCPRHTVMMYLAPLVAHTHATVRAAAADMVAWWIKQDWVSSAHTLAFGVDSALNGSGLNLDDDSDETEPAQEADEDEDMPQATDDMSGLEGDASATITDILETPARRKRAKKWLLYKSLGAFLWRLAHADRQKPHGNGDAADADGMDAESRQLWVLEQAASRIEEIWSTPASSLGFSLSEETVAALAGSTIGDIPPTPLDAAIDEAAGANIGSVLPRPVAAAQALYHKLPELADVDTISSFLTWDHSTQVSRGGESTALSRFSLAPAEETALLQAYAVWVLERNKTINDKLKRVRNKEKADLEEELRAPSKQWQLTMVPLLVRNIDCPVRLLPLVFLATESLDPQVLFDANKTDALQDIAKNLSLVLERYGGNVRLARLVASFLERVDATKILRAADEMAEDIDGQEQPSAATAPGPLVTKAVESTAAALSTAVAAVPETRVGASLSAYADVYARIVALRSFIHTKDISALMATSSESSEAADGRADLTGRSAECAIEQIFALLASAARCLSSPTVPESTALAALDTAYYFVLWRALGFSQLLAQGAAHPYSESEPTPFWQRANAAVKLLVRDRDTLVATCLELVDVAGTNYRRLREMAFTVLGNTVKLFTGSLARRPAEPAVESAAVRHMALLRRTLALPNSVSVQQRLIQFFGHKVSAWSALLLSLSGHEPKLSGDLAITAP